MLVSDILLWKQVARIKGWGQSRRFIKISFALWLGLFCAFPLSAQTRTDFDYKVYKKTFQKEIKELGKNSKGISGKRSIFYVQLPGWFFHQQRNTNQIQAIGISDPGMDSSKAMIQAVMRAYGVAILYRGCRIHCMTHLFNEFYPTEKENFLRFISLNSLDADTSFNTDSFKIINKTMLPSKEMIVEIILGGKANIQNPVLHFRLHLDFYTQEESRNSKEAFQSKISWKLSDVKEQDSLTDNFNLYGVKPAYLWTSRFMNAKNNSDSLGYSYFYWTKDSLPFDTTARQSYSLRQGLWPAYLNAVVNNLVFSVYSRQCKADVKSLSDFYNLKTVSFSQTLDSDLLSDLYPVLFLNNNYLSVKTLNP